MQIVGLIGANTRIINGMDMEHSRVLKETDTLGNTRIMPNMAME